jgi:hypothetical protein
MIRSKSFLLTNVALGAVLAFAIGNANAADGINYLVGVTQLKASNANDDALKGAEKQRELVKKQQQLRGSQPSVGSQDRLGNFEMMKVPSQQEAQHKKAQDLQTRKNFDTKAKELQSQDRLGNFEIQNLMSQYNQAETLSSSALKKKDDTHNGFIQKF